MSLTSKIGLADALTIGRLDGHDQAALIVSGEASSAELVEAAILRIEAIDPKLNAVSHRAFDIARRRAVEAPRPSPTHLLSGAPYLLKDSLQYPGMPSQSGSRSRDGSLASTAYPFARAFDAEGLVPVGMTTMPEFGLLGSTEGMRFGPTRNPWALERSPGGSSGGAGAAVAAGLTPLAHGSDAAGSIRIPAAACGVVGLKPGRGGNLRARAVHWLDDDQCSDSLMARSVRDEAWAFRVADPEQRPQVVRPGVRRLRIALVMDGMDGAPPSPEVADAVSKTAALCESLGHGVEIIDRPAADPEIFDTILGALWQHLGRDVTDATLLRWPGQALENLLEPWTLGLAEHCDQLTPADLERAYKVLSDAPYAWSTVFDRFDLVLSPTLATVAPPHGVLSPTQDYDSLLAALRAFIPYTPLQNMSGAPAISLPLFESPPGLPIGSMFAADRGGEELLLGLALELEAAKPWSARWPKVVHAS